MNAVVCPACGAIVESEDKDDLVNLAREHTESVHDYSLPAEHVLRAMSRGEEFH